MCEEIKNIYVLGHSMGPADVDYFDFFIRSTQMGGTAEEVEEAEEREKEPLDDLHNRLQFVIQSVGYGNDDVDDEYVDAAERKLQQEQAARNEMFEKAFMKMIGKKLKKGAATEIKPRTEDAKWHISYYSDRDKTWIETVMKELGCRNFELYSSIDECLVPFKKG